MFQPFHRIIVQVDMGDLQLAADAFGIDGVPVVLGGNVDASVGQVTHRVVAASVPEFELKAFTTESPRNQLVA